MSKLLVILVETASSKMTKSQILEYISRGRTDLIFELLRLDNWQDLLKEGHVKPLQWLVYYNDVTALKLIKERGGSFDSINIHDELGNAAFLSCITTAIGFYALMTSEMELLKTFGFYLGAGVIICCLSMLLLIPALLILLQPKAVHRKQGILWNHSPVSIHSRGY